jgi:hypothetical protein
MRLISIIKFALVEVFTTKAVVNIYSKRFNTMSEQNGTRKEPISLLMTNLVDVVPIRYGTTQTLAIAPNLSFLCGDGSRGYFTFVVGIYFKSIKEIDASHIYHGWEGFPPLVEVWLTKKPGVIDKDDVKVVTNFSIKDDFCFMVLVELRKAFDLTLEEVKQLFRYLGGMTMFATREYWSLVDFKIAAHNQLLDEGLKIGKILSLKSIKGKVFVKYSLPETQGKKQGNTILGIKKLLKNGRKHLDLTPVLDNHEYEFRKYDDLTPFLGFNVILNSHDDHDGYIVPVDNSWVKVERNRNLKNESWENNKFIKPVAGEKFVFKLGETYPLPLCTDIYEAYISARDYLVSNTSVNRESLMDFDSNYLNKEYKLSYVHYHRNLNKQTETRGLGLQSSKKK